MAGKYRVTTLGCKVNQYESQQFREVLEGCGLSPARPHESPDFAVINTCAVTSQALRKSRQAVRRERGTGNTSVIVVGCGASAEADRIRRIEGVSAVFGHDLNAAEELRRFILQRLAGTPGVRATTGSAGGNAPARQPEVPGKTVWMIPGESPRAEHELLIPVSLSSREIISADIPLVKADDTLNSRIERFEGHQRAFLKIQDGCDAFCTYCIIPRLRPTLRSKPVEAAVEEAEQLVAAGHKEIILTGIFLGAYGRETAIRKRFARQRAPLVALIDAIARIDGLERLRLSSLEPGDVTEELLEVMALHETCVPHLHLPLQSGSEEMLRSMNRQYTRDEYLGMIDLVRRHMDMPAISTDIIVGFPGEREEDFQASLDVARHVPFVQIHAFPFSPRTGTAAARWQRRFVPNSFVRERMERLTLAGIECSLAYRNSLIGSVERVIVERSAAHDPAPHDDPDSANSTQFAHGRSDRYFEIHFPVSTAAPGDVLHIQIDRVTPTRTHGRLAAQQNAFVPANSLIESIRGGRLSTHAESIAGRHA